MPLQCVDQNLTPSVSMTPKSSVRSANMREDDYFLNVVTADLDNFCSKYENIGKTDNLRSAVVVFPSIDCRHRKLLHALISQRYQLLSHASVGVEPDRRPVAIFRDYLLKVILPARFKSIQNGTKTMAYSEFTFCQALLETCRDNSEAKRFIERLYAFRLADQRIIATLGDNSPHRHSAPEDTVTSPPPVTTTTAQSASKRHSVKPGCERYVPRPMRLLQEQQKKSEDLASQQKTVLQSHSVPEVISDLQKMRISSFDNESGSSASPTIESPKVIGTGSEVFKPANGSSQARTPKLSTSTSKTETPLSSSNNNLRRKSVEKNGATTTTNGSIVSLRFLGDFVGISTNIVQIPLERYAAYRSEPPPLDYEALSHVLEISGFPKEWRGADLQRFLPVATFIHWVDDTHVLAVFRSISEAKSFSAPPEICLSVEVRPIRNATVESKYKAHRIFDDLVSRLRKPQTSAVVVRRVLNHHLRLGLKKPEQPVSAKSTIPPLVNGAARDT